MNSLILVAIGILIGIVVGLILSRVMMSKRYVPVDKHHKLQEQLNQVAIEKASMLSKQEVSDVYISKDLHNSISGQLNQAKAELNSKDGKLDELQNTIVQLTADVEKRLTKEQIDQRYKPLEAYNLVNDKLSNAETSLNEKEAEIVRLNNELTTLKEQEKHVKEKLMLFTKEIESLHNLSREQFQNLATDIFEKKQKTFVETNKTEMSNIIQPFEKNLSEFREKVEKTRADDIKDITSLKKEIESLHKLNNELSEDAKNLAHALKADVKLQGSWGEDRLNMILETEGLQKYIDYTREEMYRDNEQEKNRKPDFILKLPNGKYIVIDSKVSLNAYVDYHNAETIEERTGYLKQHSKSITDHIDKLADKNYQTLAGLNTPDFVFMFVPIESALTLALNNTPDLFNYALKKKIVLITPSTFVASMKVVKLLWAKENQVKNVEEIFRQAGELYNKFVSFLEFMDKIEDGLNIANKAHHDAMYALKDGSKKGATIIGRFETIRALEAKVNKRIPDKHLSEINLSVDTDFEISEGPALPESDKQADANQDISADTEI